MTKTKWTYSQLPPPKGRGILAQIKTNNLATTEQDKKVG